MNPSGPSWRPRKPYPLALLNHLTVPFNRSTGAPPLFCEFPRKGAIPGARKKCVGIVLLTALTVKDWNHIAVELKERSEVRGPIAGVKAAWVLGFYLCPL